MNEHSILPETHASLLVKCAGQKYRPSNGTEADFFFNAWCRQCARDRAMREREDIADCDDSQLCEIISKTMAHEPNEPEYPNEWQYGKDGQPLCTAYVPAGEPIPDPPDVHTIDMFNEAPK